MKGIAIPLAILIFTSASGSNMQKQRKFPLKAGDLKKECNFLGLGDETVQSAAPITMFSTSGDDFGPNFCIAKCKGGNSIKAAINFQPSNSSAPVLAVKTNRSVGGKRVFNVSGKMDDDDDYLCMDNEVAALADTVFKTYNDVESMANALNYYENKTGWAYLVYQMAPPPSFVSTSKFPHDPNICMKSYRKIEGGIISISGIPVSANIACISIERGP
ncbi:hypothetical protein Aduo_016415 [Ancylostoma duodenale]